MSWLNIAPGGLIGSALPAEGGGSVEIAATEHPIITGDGTGGLPLTDLDLDPDFTGSGGNLFDAPDGAVVIAKDGLGPVVVEYVHGDGRALVATGHDSYTPDSRRSAANGPFSSARPPAADQPWSG